MFVLPKDCTFEGDFYTQIKGFQDSILHAHNFVELLIVTSGSIPHMLNGKKNVLNVGDALLLMPGDEHCFLPPQNEKSCFHRDILFSVDFFKKACDFYSPTLYENFIQKKYQLQFKLSPEQFSQIENYISTFILDKKLNDHDWLISSLCTYIINILLSQHLQLSSYPQWIASLLSVFNNPANLSYSLTSLTKDIHLTHSYMCRDFKKHVGITMTEYFNNQKIYYAHALLTTSTHSIEKICEMIGINNVSHFYKLYKKIYGSTPKKARQRASLAIPEEKRKTRKKKQIQPKDIVHSKNKKSKENKN